MPASDGKMYVTINTDASFKDGVGGYAYWITTNSKRYTGHGKIQSKLTNSTQAEVCAIGYAIAFLISNNIQLDVDCFVFNTDSMNARYNIENGKGQFGSRVKRGVKKLRKTYNASSYFKHVRAHTGKNDARSYVNEWCDSKAKKWTGANPQKRYRKC